ncbi:MAG: RIP metalloprotease RseP [Anaerolineales bacterium]|nr:RIP metalloprotease RseP [Anaerolineales bacterium]
MDTIISQGTNLLIFAAMLGILVFVHELGHFAVAKRLGIPVLEFGFGFPPRVKSLFKRDGTEYTLNAIPLGGFVRLHGEEDPTVPGGFASAKVSIRVPILLAGVTMNFILAALIFTLTAFFTPPYTSIQTTTIAEVVVNSPAALGGLREGDTIVAVNGQNIKDDFSTFSQLIRENAGRQVALTVVRKNQTLDPIQVTPRVNPPADQGPLGIKLISWKGLRVMGVAPGSVADKAGVREGDALLFFVESNRPLRAQDELAQYTQTHPGWKIEWRIVRDNPLGDVIVVQIPETITPDNVTLGLDLQVSLLGAPIKAAQDMWLIAASIPTLFRQLVTGAVPANALVGPIGIGQLTSEVAQRGGPLGLLYLLALLSLNLAVVNLLPFPALDGGRLVFIALEVVRGGKKLDPQKEGMVHLVGLAILVGLMLIISYFDVLRLIAGQPILPAP